MIRFAQLLVVIALLVSVAGLRLPFAAGQEAGEIRIVQIMCEGEGERTLEVVDEAEALAPPPESCSYGASSLSDNLFLSSPGPPPPSDAFPPNEPGIVVIPAVPGDHVLGDPMDPSVLPLSVIVVAGETVFVRSVEYAANADAAGCDTLQGLAAQGEPDPVVENGPRLRWSMALPGASGIYGMTAAGDDGVALVFASPMTNDSGLAVIHSADGSVAWCQEFPGTFLSPPVFADGVVAVGEGRGDMPGAGDTVGFDATTGTELWRVSAGITGFPASSAGEGLLLGYAGMPNPTGLVAIDLSSGQERWRYDPQTDWQPGPPVVTNGLVYVPVQYAEGLPAPAVVALDSASGDVSWVAEIGGEFVFFESAAFADGMLYAGGMEMAMSPDASCCVIALNGESGEEVWRSDASAIDPFTQPVVADGMVYVGGSGSVAALNTLTGDLLWKAELGPFGSSIQSSPVVIDGQVVVIGPMGTEESGELFLSGFDEATGTELWRLPLGPPDMPISPVALGEAVFVAGNSELLALEPA